MLGMLWSRGSHLALSIFILRFLSVRTVRVDGRSIPWTVVGLRMRE